jgi:hypothetical protein
MSIVLELSCWVYKRMLPLYADNLRYRYGDEMEQLFREQLMDAGKEGSLGNWQGLAVCCLRCRFFSGPSIY